MSVGLDSEGLLVVYADWIAFLREKRGLLEGQLAKLQGKDKGKENTLEEGAVSIAMPPPGNAPLPQPETLAPVEPEVPDWLLSAETALADNPLLAPASPPQGEVDEMDDEWM